MNRLFIWILGLSAGAACLGAGVYLVRWESAASGTIDLGNGETVDFANNWYQLIARGLGVFMIGFALLVWALTWYLSERAERDKRSNEHLERIALYTYEALDDDEDEAAAELT